MWRSSILSALFCFIAYWVFFHCLKLITWMTSSLVPHKTDGKVFSKGEKIGAQWQKWMGDPSDTGCSLTLSIDTERSFPGKMECEMGRIRTWVVTSWSLILQAAYWDPRTSVWPACLTIFPKRLRRWVSHLAKYTSGRYLPRAITITWFYLVPVASLPCWLQKGRTQLVRDCLGSLSSSWNSGPRIRVPGQRC